MEPITGAIDADYFLRVTPIACTFESVVGGNCVERSPADQTFRTDSNGYDLIDRPRYPFPLLAEDPVEANLFPVTRFCIVSVSTAIFTSPALGAAAGQHGPIDMLLVRNAINKDYHGVPEHLHERFYTEGEIEIVTTLHSPDFSIEEIARQHQILTDAAPVVLPKSYVLPPFTVSGIPYPSVQLANLSFLRVLTDLRSLGTGETKVTTLLRLYNLHPTKNIEIRDLEEFVRNYFNIGVAANNTQGAGSKPKLLLEERSVDFTQPITGILTQSYQWRDVESLRKHHEEDTPSLNHIIIRPMKMRTYRVEVIRE